MNICQKIRSTVGRVLLGFDHGLGDYINFLPVYKELCKQTKKNISLSSSLKRQFHLIDKSVNFVEGMVDRHAYNFYYQIKYPDSKNLSVPMEYFNEPAKPYLCAYYELGMDKFMWKPVKLENKWFNPHSKRVGVHLCGHTGMHSKFCPSNVAKTIWNEIKFLGYEPFEVHMEPQFSKEYNIDDLGNHEFDFIDKTNSLRFVEPDLGRMIKEIGQCRFFVGIDSGPIYLASAILGSDFVVGLYNQKRHDHFLPKKISMVSVHSYRKNSIKRVLNQKEMIA